MTKLPYLKDVSIVTGYKVTDPSYHPFYVALFTKSWRTKSMLKYTKKNGISDDCQ